MRRGHASGLRRICGLAHPMKVQKHGCRGPMKRNFTRFIITTVPRQKSGLRHRQSPLAGYIGSCGIDSVDEHSRRPRSGNRQLKISTKHDTGSRYFADLSTPVFKTLHAASYLQVSQPKPIPQSVKQRHAKSLSFAARRGKRMAADFEALEKIAARPHKTHVSQLSHMPTAQRGTHKRAFQKKRIAFGKKHGIVIVNDNPYSFILSDNPMSIMQVNSAQEICVENRLLSKSHNMPGWRVGITLLAERSYHGYSKVKSNIDSGRFEPLMLRPPSS